MPIKCAFGVSARVTRLASYIACSRFGPSVLDTSTTDRPTTIPPSPMSSAKRTRNLLSEAEKVAKRNESIALREAIDRSRSVFESEVRTIAADKNR